MTKVSLFKKQNFDPKLLEWKCKLESYVAELANIGPFFRPEFLLICIAFIHLRKHFF